MELVRDEESILIDTIRELGYDPKDASCFEGEGMNDIEIDVIKNRFETLAGRTFYWFQDGTRYFALTKN